MYIKDIYITFIKKHWKYYIFYFLSFISIPINQVVVPHYYGKIIELLKGKNIEKVGKFLAKLLGIWVLIQGLNYTQALAELNVWLDLHPILKELCLILLLIDIEVIFKN